MFMIANRIVEVPEQAGIRRNSESTFAQHVKAVERSDGVRFYVD
jgi:hypothetical protein